jgi:hypothetical protein
MQRQNRISFSLLRPLISVAAAAIMMTIAYGLISGVGGQSAINQPISHQSIKEALPVAGRNAIAHVDTSKRSLIETQGVA